MTVMHGGNYLSEETSCLPLAQASALTDVVIQLALAGVLHHNHDLVLVLKHWGVIRKQLGACKSVQVNVEIPNGWNYLVLYFFFFFLKALCKPVSLLFWSRIPNSTRAHYTLHFSRGNITQTPPHVFGSDTTLQGGAFNSVRPTPWGPREQNQERAWSKSRRCTEVPLTHPILTSHHVKHAHVSTRIWNRMRASCLAG